jgi:hypothetical protein
MTIYYYQKEFAHKWANMYSVVMAKSLYMINYITGTRIELIN